MAKSISYVPKSKNTSKQTPDMLSNGNTIPQMYRGVGVPAWGLGGQEK